MSRPSLDLSFSAKDHIVRAGAGAGKTHNLVECVYESYQHLIKSGKKNPRFVMTTFTRKATHELRERMVLKACRTKDEAFFDFVTDPSRLHISTIHGVLTQFLKEFGHLHDLDLSIQVLDAFEESQITLSCVRKLLVEDENAMVWLDIIPLRQLGKMLNLFSNQWAENPGLRPLSFDDLLESIDKKFTQLIHNFSEHLAQGLETIDDPAYSEYLVQLLGKLENVEREAAKEIEIPSPPRKSKRESFPVEYHLELQDHIEKLRDQLSGLVWDEETLMSIQDQWLEFFDLGVRYSALLKSEKIKQGHLSMGDLESMSLEILKKTPFLGKIFSENFDFWLVDEFQDTSHIQLEILNHLIGEKPRFVVGDPQQSIYLFRGAQSGLFFKEMERITSQQGRLSVLDVNFRSQEPLLEVFNQVMSSAKQFSPMKPLKPALTERAVLTLLSAVDLEDELKGLAAQIFKLSQNGKHFDGICVLARAHDDLFKVATYLKSLGMPTHVHSPSGFWSRHEIKDALSLLKFLINPHDNLNLLQILRAPWLKVRDQVLVHWMTDQPRSLWNKIKNLKGEDAIDQLLKAKKNAVDVGISRAFMDLINDSQFLNWNLKNDPAGRVEANVWKLISKIQELEQKPGSHLLELFHDQGLESDAVAATEPNCVNLMTIHGSKGLEFKHVLIPRVGRRTQSTKRGEITFSADDSHFVFSLKNEDGDALVTSVERDWIDAMRELDAMEAERLFYVALTRAKESVTISWSQKELNAYSWVEHFSLDALNIDRTELFQGPFEAPLPLASDRSHSKVRSSFRDLSVTKSMVRGSFSQIKASAQIGFNRSRILNQFKSQAKGVDWHRRFESLKYLKDLAPSAEFDFLLNMKSPPFMDILKSGFVEWGFQSQLFGRILEGQIDLWGFDQEQNVWVIDYKTGSTDDIKTAQLQVEFYLWILKRKLEGEGKALPQKFLWALINPLTEKVFTGEATNAKFNTLELELGLTQ